MKKIIKFNKEQTKFLAETIDKAKEQQKQEMVEGLENIVKACQKIREEETRKMNIYMDNGMVYNPVSQSYALVIEGIVDKLK